MHKLKYFKLVANRYTSPLAIIICLLYALVGSLISVHRFWQYDVFYFDFGIFDSAIWNVSQFSAPIIDHITLGETLIFADHFSPSLFLLSPFFWIFPSNETLLVIQATAVAASGLFLFLIGKDLLKNNFFALVIMLCYFLFIGLQNAIITDFHESTVATLTFMLIWFSIIKQNKKLYFLSLLLLFGFKETFFLIGIGIAIALFFVMPKWRKISFITFIISLMWGILTIKFIIPYFSGGTYLYQVDSPTNPLVVITSLFNNEVKINTLTYSFLSFGFLPLIAPPFWILLIQDFLVRFYGEFPTRWGLGFHYSALTAAIMSVSSLYSLLFLEKKLKVKPIYLTIFVFLLLFNSLFLYRFVLRGPFALSYNPVFYKHTQDFNFLDEAVKKIPNDATIMTQNNLAAHFTHRKTWLLTGGDPKKPIEKYSQKKPDYILIDNRDGQNPNNLFGVTDINYLLTKLKNDTIYSVYYNKDNLWIFKRNK